MDAKSKLHSWCLSRGLNLNYQSYKTDTSTFKSEVIVDSFDFSGVGEAPTKKWAEKNASQNFFDRLIATNNDQDDESGTDASGAPVIGSKHQGSSKSYANVAIFDAKSFLCRWCKINSATDAYDYSYEGDPHSRIFYCSIEIKSSSGGIVYRGKASAPTKKTANHLAAKKAVRYLLANKLIEPHEIKHIDLSLPEDGTGTHSVHRSTPGTSYNVHSVTNVQKFVNTSPVTDLSLIKNENGIQTDDHSTLRVPYNVHSISEVQESVNNPTLTMEPLSTSSGNWTIDAAQGRLQQFLQENNINADFNYTTDCYNLEGYHVAHLRIHVIWVGRLFRAVGHACTKEEASKKCAFSLVKQLYRANLIEAYNDGGPKKDESIPVSEKEIDAHVPDEAVQNIKDLCAEFGEEVPRFIGNRDRNGPFLLSPVSSSSEDFTSIDDIVQPKYGVARMNWNPWTSSQILKNEYNYDVSLRDISRNMKIAYKERSSSVTFEVIQRERQSLPIFQFKEEILNSIDDNPVIIVKGATGCGKSTQVCQYILDEAIENNMGSHCNIAVVEPYRMCATWLAECVARQRSEPLGQTVGYSVRFDSCFPHSHGAILFCTTGSFIRKFENGLSGISHIIVDEIQERTLETDYILIILRDMLRNNPTLKVILLSGNIDTDLFTSYFGGCPHVSVLAQIHPVQDYFLEDCIELINFKVRDSHYKSNFELDSDDEVFCSVNKSVKDLKISKSPLNVSHKLKTVETVVEKQQLCFEFIEAIISWLREQRVEGSILVFLPGWSDIRDALQYLRKSKLNDSFCFLTVHPKKSNEELMEVFLPVSDRMTKVILSTSIAESALAIDNVVCVIDSCKTSVLRSQINSASKLVTEWTSKVNLDQRLAIAGRKKPGYCFRLCSKSRYEILPERMEPEILRMPLYNVALSIKHLKRGSIKEQLNNAIQPPKQESIEEAERFLIELNCMDVYKELTPLGNILARLPLDLRLGRMVLMSTLFNCTDQILKLAAFISTQQEFFIENPTGDMRWVANERFSDHIAVLYNWSVEEKSSIRSDSSQVSSYYRIEILNIEKQLYSILEQIGFDLTEIYSSGNKNFEIVSALSCQAFYPDVCIRGNKRNIYFSDGKFGLISRKTLMNVKDRNFNPRSPIFVYGERDETQINVCRNLTMVMPVHLLCFTNCKVTTEGEMVKIDDWLTLRMDPNVAVILMSVRSIIDKALLEIIEDPTRLNKLKFFKLKKVVSRLCMIGSVDECTSVPSSSDPQKNFFRRPAPGGRGRFFDVPKNHNNGCSRQDDHQKGVPSGFVRQIHQKGVPSGFVSQMGRGRGRLWAPRGSGNCNGRGRGKFCLAQILPG
ncbi:hypothetical protein LSTR_LSTR012999 [Laodelphax striatellus]|uniref:RNA helicase n=1 Tax=Laodelphax striatellus TaxID=195883 RepID=A0A482WIF7_LAOST|nr:hypothetical protein LSTR_LSTR012999 [Laodelphax striatellus]